MKAPWEPGLELEVAGDCDDMHQRVTPMTGLTPAEEVFIKELTDSGAVLCHAHQSTTRTKRHGQGETVDFWLDAGRALGGGGPLGEMFERRRRMYSFLPELRGEPQVATLMQSDLQDLYTRVTGEWSMNAS